MADAARNEIFANNAPRSPAQAIPQASRVLAELTYHAATVLATRDAGARYSLACLHPHQLRGTSTSAPR